VRIDTVDRDPVKVIYAAAPGDWNTIPAAAARAFERLEALIPPRGRKIYGYWHPPALEYRACYARQEWDDPAALGLREDVLPGGRYARVRLRGDGVFAEIGPSFAALAEEVHPDDERPWLEFYRRHDEVDLLVPVAG
jgi:DNA gyrase inhibitor GyrI